jgi:FixJ family two-component response regulator
MNDSAIIYLVDDEPGILKALTRLLGGEGFPVKSFESAKTFLAEPKLFGCVILDVAMPEMDGMEVLRLLRTKGSHVPVIFLTGHGDIPMSVRAMKSGAVDFLTKPVRSEELIRAVKSALDLLEKSDQKQEEVERLQIMYAQLTAREKVVLAHVISGKPNKQIAFTLGTIEQTVKIHRMRVMHKMQAESIVDLVHIAQSLGVSAAE